jgi:hypothetical protein
MENEGCCKKKEGEPVVVWMIAKVGDTPGSEGVFLDEKPFFLTQR